MSDNLTEKKNNGLIGLRGILVLMTAVGFHYASLYGTVPATASPGKVMFDIFYLFGLTAPNVFFIMSGYFMYARYREKIAGGLGFGDYILPRIKKMYPLMLFFTVYLFAVENIGKMQLGYYPLHAAGGELRYSLKALIVSLLGIQSGIISDSDALAVNGPSWFIPSLLISYTLFFLIIKGCHHFKQAGRRILADKNRELIIYVILGIAGMILVFRPVPFPLLYASAGRGYLFFSSGVVMRILMERSGERERRRQICIALLLLAAAGAAAIMIDYDDFTVWQTYVAWPCVVYLILNLPILEKILSFPPFVWAGKRSMSVFLGNLPILTTLSYLNLRFQLGLDYASWSVWFVTLGITLLAAEVTYAVFEKWIPSVLRKETGRQK